MHSFFHDCWRDLQSHKRLIHCTTNSRPEEPSRLHHCDPKMNLRDASMFDSSTRVALFRRLHFLRVCHWHTVCRNSEHFSACPSTFMEQEQEIFTKHHDTGLLAARRMAFLYYYCT